MTNAKCSLRSYISWNGICLVTSSLSRTPKKQSEKKSQITINNVIKWLTKAVHVDFLIVLRPFHDLARIALNTKCSSHVMSFTSGAIHSGVP
jgi:hypothetical protein